jgi:hypothetical protein
MCLCVWVCVCGCVRIVGIGGCGWVCGGCGGLCVREYKCVCVCTCVCVSLCVCMCVSMCVSMCACMHICVCASYLGILTANSSSIEAPGNRPLKAGSTLNTRHFERMANKAAVRGVCPSPTTTHVVLRSESCTTAFKCSYNDKHKNFNCSKSRLAK